MIWLPDPIQGLSSSVLCIPVEMTLSMKNLEAKETRRQLFQPGRQGRSLVQKQQKFMSKLWTKTAFLESQSCILPTKCINPNQSFHASQLSESQALKGADVFHEVWGFVMGDFNGFNTQIYTFSSNCKGQIYVMFCSGLILIPLSWDRFTVVVKTDLL